MNLDRSKTRAKRIEDAIRERAILPVNAEINGIEVKQFTLQHWLILSAIRSPFLTSGGIPTAADIGAFLWIISPEYQAQSFGTAFGWLSKIKRRLAVRKRRRFLGRVVRQPHWLNFEPRIRKYLARAFMDKPATSSSGKAISAGVGASMIHRIAYVYHWSREEILNMPLTEAFQYLNWIGANQPQFNPLQSAVVNRWYDRQDAIEKAKNGVATNGG